MPALLTTRDFSMKSSSFSAEYIKFKRRLLHKVPLAGLNPYLFLKQVFDGGSAD
jgi:hypothetical protein